MRKITLLTSLGLVILLVIEARMFQFYLSSEDKMSPRILAPQDKQTIQAAVISGISDITPPNVYGQLLTPTPTPIQAADSAQTQNTLSGNLPENMMLTDSLTVLGDTILGKTTIAGGLSVDGAVQLTAAGIQSSGNTLYIQKNSLAPLNMMDGALIINTAGDVTIKNLTVDGELAVNQIIPFDTNITIRLASEAGKFDKLLVKGTNGNVVAQIDASGTAHIRGDLNASGSGIFASIKAPSIETHSLSFTRSAAGQTGDSVGQSTIPAGYAQMMILDNLITPESHVFVTPITTTALPIAVSDLKAATTSTSGSFTVYLSSPAPTDIDFNWFIVN